MKFGRYLWLVAAGQGHSRTRRKKETLSIDQPVMLDDESSIESLEPVVVVDKGSG